ncbi:tripartite tricarboxylate transporter substrate binding protein [Sedimentitalea sp.]|uniref:Bug family tripartite tricarboxylate transporter substrate binding protein n=1 Tax=Sedimentitalea sp. TaxID=2048915 RepID=UPI003298166B
MKNFVKIAALLVIGAAISPSEADAEWPEKPVKLVVPFAAGGAADLIARAVQKGITDGDFMDEPLTIVNVPGHYSMGMRQVKDATPDGYSFALIQIALMAGEVSEVIDFGYRDYEPVATIGSLCEAIGVREDLEAGTLDDLLNMAAEKPSALIAGVNLGALNHTAMLIVEALRPGAAFRYVQTGGDAKSYAALAGGHTDVAAMAAGAAIAYTHVDGKPIDNSGIRLLAYTGPERSDQLPEVPTLKELGYDAEFCIDMWVFAPRGTPEEAVDGFAQVLRSSIETEVVKGILHKQAVVPKFLAGEEMASDLDNKWEMIVPIAKRAAGQ